MASDVNIIGLAPAMRQIIRNETPGLAFGAGAALRRLIQAGYVHVIQPRGVSEDCRAWLRDHVAPGAWRRGEYWPLYGFLRAEDAIAFRMRFG